MHFPETSRLELPILQELKATGGGDRLRYLYDRLVRYFPQLSPADLDDRAEAVRGRWRSAVRRAGKQLQERGELRRENSHWHITAKGLKRVEAEEMRIERQPARAERKGRAISHKEAQTMLVEIGQLLGRHAEVEYEHYDVVWRDAASAPRLSHVFEVQISGSVDGALARLKKAHDAQRSRIFLVIADERDKEFAQKRLTAAFHELWDAVTVIGVGELQRLHEMLKTQGTLLTKLVAK